MTPGERRRGPRLAGALLVSVLTVAAFFTVYEILERSWIRRAHPRWIPLLHIVRGVGSSLVAAGLASWYLLYSAAPLLKGGLRHEAAPFPFDYGETFRRYSRWLIQTRWLAVLAGFALLWIACRTVGILPYEKAFWPILLCLAGLAAANGLFAWLGGRFGRSRHFLIGQMIVDAATLTIVLRFSGGMENPLHALYLFHIVLAAILLPRREALWITASTLLLLGGIAVGELSGVWEHVPIRLRLAGAPASFQDPLYVGGHLFPLLVILPCVAFFVMSIVERLRASEVHLARAAQMAGIGELAGRIAHEVNNPAGVIRAKAKLLLMDMGPACAPMDLARLRAELEKIANQADRIGRITQGVLSFSRPSIGRRSPQDAGRILAEALTLVEETCRSRGIRVERSGPGLLPEALVNREEVQQVFLNLLTNAIDAMPHGGILTVEAAQDSPDSIQVSFGDTGTGIPQEHLEKIFLPFFTTKEQGKGTGLGLSISQGIVHSHGGEILVESRTGQGSRFTVRLPAAGEQTRLEGNGRAGLSLPTQGGGP